MPWSGRHDREFIGGLGGRKKWLRAARERNLSLKEKLDLEEEYLKPQYREDETTRA